MRLLGPAQKILPIDLETVCRKNEDYERVSAS